MYLVFNDVIYAEKAIELGKTGIPIKFVRDGVRSENDLDIIMKFKQEGFLCDIKMFKGGLEENAICINFYFPPANNGYI